MTLYRVKVHGEYLYYNSKEEASKIASIKCTHIEPIEVNVDLLNEYESRLSYIESNIKFLTGSKDINELLDEREDIRKLRGIK